MTGRLGVSPVLRQNAKTKMALNKMIGRAKKNEKAFLKSI